MSRLKVRPAAVIQDQTAAIRQLVDIVSSIPSK
jgi:hypothetical protein